MKAAALLLIGAFASMGTALAAPVHDVTTAEVFFSPGDSGQAALCRHIDDAKGRVRTSIFLFSKNPIADALIRAHRRGVDVAVILDGSHLAHPKNAEPGAAQGPSPVLRKFQAAGVPVYVDTTHKTMHNKFTVVDERHVLTGSYNYNNAAEKRNAENLLVLDSPSLARQYEADWETHRAHCITP